MSRNPSLNSGIDWLSSPSRECCHGEGVHVLGGKDMEAITSIPQMVDVLRRNPAVVGLVEYGSATYLDGPIEGDYDLVAITDLRVSGVESLHFYVEGTPVDLNIRTLQQIDAMDRVDGFESILLDARIIHDPSGRVVRTLNALQKRHCCNPATRIGNDRIAAKRHGAKHTFDKLRKGRDLPLTLKRYRTCVMQ